MLPSDYEDRDGEKIKKFWEGIKHSGLSLKMLASLYN